MKPIHSLTLCAGLLALSACQSQTDTISLAGEWRFAIDSLDRGQTEGWATRQLSETLRLPGSMQEQGYGDNVSVKTPWTGQIVDQSWYTAPEYAKYREPGNIKVPFWLNPDKHYVGAAWYQRTVDINSGTGIVVIGLACLIIGETVVGKGSGLRGVLAVILGSVIYRFLYAVILKTSIVPIECLKLVTAVIVGLAIAAPALKAYFSLQKRKIAASRKKGGK